VLSADPQATARRTGIEVRLTENLLALVPKSHQDMVAAVFRTIFAQPDPDTVASTWDQIRDQLADRFPTTGPHGRRQDRSARLQRLPPSPLDQSVEHG
jgi:transposase-like protein